MSDSLKQQGKALENRFFQQLDQKLLDEIRGRLDNVSKRDALAEVSRIRNHEVLDQLLKLGIDATTFAALTFIPLASVAWADGSLEPGERQALLEAAEQHGIHAGKPGYIMLDQWFQHPPGEELLQAWKDYIAALKQEVDPQWIAALKEETLSLAERVAEASGGILGLVLKVSAAERKRINELAAAFD